MKTERRFFKTQIEFRVAADGKPACIHGYAATYGNPSSELRCAKGSFVEVIEPGFFDPVMQDDVRALFNHNPDAILARSKGGAGTLRLFSDATGLGYEFDAPDTTVGRDLAVSIARGDVDASSFSFAVRDGGDTWERRNQVLIRTLKAGGCAALLDVSPVVYPAYPDTEVSLRSLDQFLAATSQEQKATQPPRDLWERRLASLVR